jgi:hypothetical protein
MKNLLSFNRFRRRPCLLGSTLPANDRQQFKSEGQCFSALPEEATLEVKAVTGVPQCAAVESLIACWYFSAVESVLTGCGCWRRNPDIILKRQWQGEGTWCGRDFGHGSRRGAGSRHGRNPKWLWPEQESACRGQRWLRSRGGRYGRNVTCFVAGNFVGFAKTWFRRAIVAKTVHPILA